MLEEKESCYEFPPFFPVKTLVCSTSHTLVSYLPRGHISNGPNISFMAQPMKK